MHDHPVPDEAAEEPLEKPWLLRAIELVLADPGELRAQALATRKRFAAEYRRDESDTLVREKAAQHVVATRSNHAAFVGAATGLTGVIPGLGTVLATVGGASADAALTMKYQIEMVMEIATIYDHDVRIDEEKMICMFVAGLGATNQFVKEAGKQLSSKAFVTMVQQTLRGALLQAVKVLFRQLGITFSRKALEKAIPFGIGVVIGGVANKALTSYVGGRAIDTYKVL